jgi:DNA-binding transcriptional LysR family regulator
MVNYKHLHYFWVVAKEGGIARASERLHLTPQTISGQLTSLEKHLGISLFSRVGRNLEITETGRLVLSYADEIFSLGGELEELIHQLPAKLPQTLRVGVVDVVPKSIAHRILHPALRMPEPVRMVCRESSLDTLLAELAVHRLLPFVLEASCLSRRVRRGAEGRREPGGGIRGCDGERNAKRSGDCRLLVVPAAGTPQLCATRSMGNTFARQHR